jgi:CxC1 like cysteine cluster associated with KDZ transposases
MESCECIDMFQVLVSNGLFPTSPSKPRMAVSISLLDFYDALFNRSCDAVNAMASALNSHYTQRGFVLLNSKVLFFSSFLLHDTDFEVPRVMLYKMLFVEVWDMPYSGMIA